jgi:hypothetical protein
LTLRPACWLAAYDERLVAWAALAAAAVIAAATAYRTREFDMMRLQKKKVLYRD